jgi:L-Ala-D/L-Glu epimerase
MQIHSVELHHIRIPFRSGFRHALKSRHYTEAVIVAMRSADEVGYGEILPREYLTGETIEGVLCDQAPALARDFLNAEFSAREEVVQWLLDRLQSVGRALATFCGFELALLDLAGKSFGLTIDGVLDVSLGPELPAGVVIGFDISLKSLPAYCSRLRLMGKRHIKAKVGQADDLQRLETIISVLGESACVRIDANGAWQRQEAVDILHRMAHLNVHSIEQPVPAADLEGMRYVREQTGMAVMADESLCTLKDAERLIEEQAADLFNIRIGKCGGVLACSRLVALARHYGLRCHLGTLVGETGILSRAGEIFGRMMKGFDCLEGKGQNRFLLEHDIVESACFGLGVDVDLVRLEKSRCSEPMVFSSA